MGDVEISSTNVYVLIATALLGVLLLVVVNLAREMPVEPAGDFIREPSLPARTAEPPPDIAAAEPADAGLPVIRNRADLVAFLDGLGFDGDDLVSEAAQWRQRAGFNEPDVLLGDGRRTAPSVYYESLDHESLKALSTSGDAAATQELAEREMLADPFSAAEIFETAINQGSTRAIIQLASLIDTLSMVRGIQFREDREFRRKLTAFQKNLWGNMLPIEALAYAILAVRDGGVAITNRKLLDWIDTLNDRVQPFQREVACRLSTQMLLEAAGQRRARGRAPLLSTMPPVFVTVPDVTDRLPCQDGDYPIDRLAGAESCAIEAARDAAGRPIAVWICIGA